MHTPTHARTHAHTPLPASLLLRFGHALQHMLTEVEEGHCSGIRGVEWDAVELPSQFMVCGMTAENRALVFAAIERTCMCLSRLRSSHPFHHVHACSWCLFMMPVHHVHVPVTLEVLIKSSQKGGPWSWRLQALTAMACLCPFPCLCEEPDLHLLPFAACATGELVL